MKTIAPRHLPNKAFTLIELLVVISIIAILAALLFPVLGRISENRSKKVAAAELSLVHTAIEAYKATYNMYPPDNKTNPALNALYYELVGTTNNGVVYSPLDGRITNAVTAANIAAKFAVGGFVNSSTSVRGTDDRPAPVTFLKEVKPDQLGGGGGVTLLVCSENGVPWSYNSSHPTNNPASFDLWVDLKVGSKTNRISNWSR
jgi:prepilin-type N-terminal cleavage/methylation domain-containing protein